MNGASMIWTAGFRSAVISPYEHTLFTEPRGFADQTVRQVLHMAGGGERLRVRLTNRYGRTALTIAAANHVTSPALPEAEQVEARFYVSGVDVLVPDDTAIAVAFGDSWFEGVGSTTGANNRSVDFLNRRLERGWVVNQGIAGNRL